MKTVKTSLTKLKHQFEQEFKVDAAFLKTITLKDVLTELDLLYTQLDKIAEITNPIEISFFKRKALKLINNALNLIKKDEWKHNEEVRLFAYLIELKHFVKQTYLIEVKGELRTEKELLAISADITKVKANLEEHIALEKQLTESKEEFEKLKNSLVTLKKSYEETQLQADDIKGWHSDLSAIKDDFENINDTATKHLSSISILANTAEKAKPDIQRYHEEIEKMIKLFRKQKEEIQEIIEDANRASMAGSFKKQVDDINTKMKWTDGFLIGALMITAAISFWGFNSSLITQTLSEGKTYTQFEWIQFFTKSAISLPFLIVAWIKSKERAYLFRLREDYAYKYSSAMAFEGYRKQVQDQSPELEQQLLQIAVDNLGANPTKVFDKDLKNTPLETIIDGVGKRFDKAVDGIKGQVKDIPQKTKELIDDE